MKFKYFVLMLCSLMISSLIGENNIAMAAKPSTSVSIAVIDVNDIFQNSLVTKDLNDQLRVKQNDMKKQFEKKETNLRETEKAIEAQKSDLSDKALKAKIDDFNKQVAEVQKEARVASAAIENSYFNTLEVVNNKLKDIIQKFSQDQSIDLVLSKPQVIYRNSSYPDITDKIIEVLNKNFSHVTMSEVNSSGKNNLSSVNSANGAVNNSINN